MVIIAPGTNCLTNGAGFLHYMRQLQQHYVPDGLFSPQEALRGIEYTWSKTDLGTPLSSGPFRHNPVRLEKLLGFSDVLAQYAWGNLSYNTSGGDWRLLDKRQAVYDKPILSHELGILSTYLDFSLRERYVGTRIGDRLFATVETMLKAAGIWNSAILLSSFCLWACDLRKHCWRRLGTKVSRIRCSESSISTGIGAIRAECSTTRTKV